MGNTKIYTFRCPLLPGESLLSFAEMSEAVRSDLVTASRHDPGHGNGPTVVMGLAESNSQVADEFIALVRRRYPNRWCMITRFDADWSDFRVITWDEGQESPTTFVADAWRKVTSYQ